MADPSLEMDGRGSSATGEHRPYAPSALPVAALEAERRAAAIRDHLGPLLLRRGQRKQYGHAGSSGPLLLPTWDTCRFRGVLRVPFGPFAATVDGASARAGVAPRTRRPALLPYGLDVRAGGRRLLSVAWEPDGAVEVVAFRRGAWEEEALRLR